MLSFHVSLFFLIHFVVLVSYYGTQSTQKELMDFPSDLCIELECKRIVGGENAEIKDFPYQLSLELGGRGGYYHSCGASIIGRSWALTAGHCLQGMGVKDVRFRSGTALVGVGGNIHYVEYFKIHPSFHSRTLMNDVAVVKVINEFQYSDSVQPIRLPKRHPSVGTSTVVSGWGNLKAGGPSPRQLQKVRIYILAKGVCTAAYHRRFFRGMLCAGIIDGGKDACQGDSGGPLTAKDELVGIVSWGDNCALPNTPGVYTDVAHYRHWILSITGKIENTVT